MLKTRNNLNFMFQYYGFTDRRNEIIEDVGSLITHYEEILPPYFHKYITYILYYLSKKWTWLFRNPLMLGDMLRNWDSYVNSNIVKPPNFHPVKSMMEYDPESILDREYIPRNTTYRH